MTTENHHRHAWIRTRLKHMTEKERNELKRKGINPTKYANAEYNKLITRITFTEPPTRNHHN